MLSRFLYFRTIALYGEQLRMVRPASAGRGDLPEGIPGL